MEVVDGGELARVFESTVCTSAPVHGQFICWNSMLYIKYYTKY